jgi:ubiquinone/menaquinone biosynthesis C-methylase UbiE
MDAGKHIGFLRELNQIHFKSWLDKNAFKVLSEVGVGEGHKLLDFGCGSGTFSIPSSRLVGTKGRVYSMDVSQTALRKLSVKVKSRNIDNISTVISIGTILPFDEDYLDHVLMIDVLQEIKDKKKLFEEVKRVLKDGGLVTVYPMHLDINEVSRIATEAGLGLNEKKVQQQILLFKKFEK